MSEKSQFRLYEQVLVLHPSCSHEEQKEICRISINLIEGRKGQLFRMDTWGSRPISNPRSKKSSRGLYFYMLFSSSVGVIEEIRKQLSLNRKVLYFHQEKLDKGEDPNRYIQNFLDNLEQTRQKEEERQAKNQRLKASISSMRA